MLESVEVSSIQSTGYSTDKSGKKSSDKSIPHSLRPLVVNPEQKSVINFQSESKVNVPADPQKKIFQNCQVDCSTYSTLLPDDACNNCAINLDNYCTHIIPIGTDGNCLFRCF